MRLGQTSRLIHYPELREERGLGPPRGEKLFTGKQRGKAEEEMFVNKSCPVMWISFLGKNVTSVNSSLPGIGPFPMQIYFTIADFLHKWEHLYLF